jgi:hypothetical protein
MVSHLIRHPILCVVKKIKKKTHYEEYKTLPMKYEVSKAVKIHIVVLWVMTLCGQVGGTNISKEYAPHLQGRHEV